MKTIKLLAVAALALIGCGDNHSVPDAKPHDGKPADAYCSNCPAAPTLGTQIDRMGRPAVNTVLNHGFDKTTAAYAAKDAYNKQSSKTDWLAAAQVAEFASNLGIIDALDSGVCGNGICEDGEVAAGCLKSVDTRFDCDATDTPVMVNGCGNQVKFNDNVGGGGTPNAMSYIPLASLLAEDELYIDTSHSNCSAYLAVEFGVIAGGGSAQSCGGRAPTYDVIDYSFSMLVSGLRGFNSTLQPQIHDGASVHSDVSDTDFPFLGAPHS